MRWALATAARTPLAPDLPILAEAGLPGFEFFSWYSVWAPRGVPAEILTRLNRILVDGTRADIARNAALLRLANVQPE